MSEVTPSIRQGTFILIVIGITAAFIGLISDFIMTAFWAVVLAVIFYGLHRTLLKRTRQRKNLSAFLATMIILFAVVIPVGLISLAMVNESSVLYNEIQSGKINVNGIISDIEQNIPRVTSLLERFGVTTAEVQTKLNEFIASVTQAVGTRALRITQNMLNFVIQFTLMLYLLYFFLRDGTQIKQAIIDVFPLKQETENFLFDRFATVARATVKGTLIVAVVQGSIGGILFAALGIKGAIFWGVLMTLLSLLPVGGSGIVWIPMSIVLIIQKEYTEAVIMIIVGSLIIGLVDNILRPLLVGRDTKMPDYLVLIATLGGIAKFGLTGFIMGPVIAAFFITCWQLLDEKFVKEEYARLDPDNQNAPSDISD